MSRIRRAVAGVMPTSRATSLSVSAGVSGGERANHREPTLEPLQERPTGRVSGHRLPYFSLKEELFAERNHSGAAHADVQSLSTTRSPTHVHDGDTVALEGFTHLIPFAAAHEIARQGRRHLTLVRMTPDVVYDQLIGLGVADELVFSYGGNPGVGSLHRLRDAVEYALAAPARRSTSTATPASPTRTSAGCRRLPFAVLRGYRGTDLEQQSDIISRVTCPFTGEELAAVKAVNPDVTVIHAQLADREGNVMLWGLTGVQREAVLAADRAIVTVEEIVDEFPERTGAVVLPEWVRQGGLRRTGWGVAVVRTRLLHQGQRLLPAMGRGVAGSRRLPRLGQGERTGGGRRCLTAGTART